MKNNSARKGGNDMTDAIRNSFVQCLPKLKLWQADLSKIEHLSDSVSTPNDIHRLVASKYYGVKYEDVTPEQRTSAKRALYIYLYSNHNYSVEQLITLGCQAMTIIEKVRK